MTYIFTYIWNTVGYGCTLLLHYIYKNIDTTAIAVAIAVVVAVAVALTVAIAVAVDFCVAVFDTVAMANVAVALAFALFVAIVVAVVFTIASDFEAIFVYCCCRS